MDLELVDLQVKPTIVDVKGGVKLASSVVDEASSSRVEIGLRTREALVVGWS